MVVCGRRQALTAGWLVSLACRESAVLPQLRERQLHFRCVGHEGCGVGHPDVHHGLANTGEPAPFYSYLPLIAL